MVNGKEPPFQATGAVQVEQSRPFGRRSPTDAYLDRNVCITKDANDPLAAISQELSKYSAFFLKQCKFPKLEKSLKDCSFCQYQSPHDIKQMLQMFSYDFSQLHF